MSVVSSVVQGLPDDTMPVETFRVGEAGFFMSGSDLMGYE